MLNQHESNNTGADSGPRPTAKAGLATSKLLIALCSVVMLSTSCALVGTPLLLPPGRYVAGDVVPPGSYEIPAGTYEVFRANEDDRPCLVIVANERRVPIFASDFSGRASELIAVDLGIVVAEDNSQDHAEPKVLRNAFLRYGPLVPLAIGTSNGFCDTVQDGVEADCGANLEETGAEILEPENPGPQSAARRRAYWED